MPGHAARSLTGQAAAILRQDHPPQAAVLDLLATTLVAGYIAPAKTGPVASMVQVGDTSAWILRDDHYTCVLRKA